MATPKYRPSLTRDQISHILTKLKSTTPLTTKDLECISILAPFAAKIENGAISVAYEIQETQSIEQKLGFAPESTPIDRKQLRLAAYNKWISNPALCSLNEIDMVHTHRYESGLMSKEEQIQFEQSLLPNGEEM